MGVFQTKVAEAIEELREGVRTSPKKNMSSVTTTNLFAITGGPVFLRSIVGRITTVFESSANAIKLQHTRTGGSAVDLSATVEGNAAAAHKFLSMTGEKTTALRISGDLGVLTGAGMTSAVVLAPGVISLNAASTTTGAAEWHVVYEPMAPGARVVPV